MERGVLADANERNAGPARRDRNNPISAKQISLQTSLINQEHRPIRLHLLAGLSFPTIAAACRSLINFLECDTRVTVDLYVARMPDCSGRPAYTMLNQVYPFYCGQ